MMVRRQVSFGTAVYEGNACVAGWSGSLTVADEAVFVPGRVVVLVDPKAAQICRLAPDWLVDARMRKIAPTVLPWPSNRIIGLGPGFVCGDNVALVVETKRGATLGQVVRVGGALPRIASPGKVGGQTTARLLRTPVAGRFEPYCSIGDLVRAGQTVGCVSGQPVVARVSGRLRGLVDGRAELLAGQKVGDVDPRGSQVDPAQLTDKARQVGQAVVLAVDILQAGGLNRGSEPGPGSARQEGD